MHKRLIVALLLLSGLSLKAQKPLVWQILGMTTYSNSYEDSPNGIIIPNFPDILVNQYEGEEVTISGYMIPIDVEANTYALSKNPFTSCFFCGNAGPETVIELKFRDAPGRFVTDEYVMIKGTLQLNRDGNGLFFTLRNAELHG